MVKISLTKRFDVWFPRVRYMFPGVPHRHPRVTFSKVVPEGLPRVVAPGMSRRSSLRGGLTLPQNASHAIPDLQVGVHIPRR